MTTPLKSKAKIKSNNTTGFHGVTKLPNGLFVGQSYFAKKTHRTEPFKKALDAAKAYDVMASEAFAKGLLKRAPNLNFPPKATK